jgi:hypothetical protein
MINILVGGNKAPYWTPGVLWSYLVGLCFSICAVAGAQEAVTLGWDPEADPTVSGYVLYYGTASLQYSFRQDVGTNTTVTIPSLTLGTNYYFVVTSYNADGVESTPSPEVSVALPPSLFLNNESQLSSTATGTTNTPAEYLQFPDGVVFGYYSPVSFPWIYHFDLGWEYLFEANDGLQGVFLYDLNSTSFWYTNPEIFPFVYDFTLNSWLYYYPDARRPGHYTSAPRYFYDFTTKKIINR